MKRIFIISGLILFTLKGQAQNPNLSEQLYSVFPPSPEAAAFAKYGNIPVGLATGIPEVSIPLFQYAGISNKLNCNISLSYHAGGVKVDEVSSMAGLGWTINYGGVVSRSVRGLVDDRPLGYMDNTVSIPGPGVSRQGVPGFQNYKFFAEKSYDSEMDIFNFSSGGRSGKFYVRKGTTNRIIIEPFQKRDITYVLDLDNTISSFTIIDEEGVKYVFSEKEISSSQTLTPDFTIIGTNTDYTSAWYLKEIQSANDSDKITYEYKPPQFYSYYSGLTQTADIVHADNFQTIPPVPATTFQSLTGYMLYPSRILLPDSTVVSFNYGSTSRLDLDGSKQLAEVVTNPIPLTCQAGEGQDNIYDKK